MSALYGRAQCRRMCAAFWNGSTPPGWVEIQRDDSAPAVTAFEDEDAAKLACLTAGVPASCAMWVAWGVPPGYVQRKANAQWMLYTIDDPSRPEGYWCAAVPAVVAFLAGLIDQAQLDAANREGT